MHRHDIGLFDSFRLWIVRLFRVLSWAKRFHRLEAPLVVCKQFDGFSQLACIVTRKWRPRVQKSHIPSRTSPFNNYFCIRFFSLTSFSDDANVTSLECHQTTQHDLTLTCHWLAETPFKGNIEFELFDERMIKLDVVQLSSNESTFIAQQGLSENGLYAVKLAAEFRIVRMTSKFKSRQEGIRQCALKAIPVVFGNFGK